MKLTNKIKKAITWVTTLHNGQLKRDGITPTAAHVIRTGLTVSTQTKKENTIIAAFLHDLLEDTKTTSENIKNEFGPQVRKLVESVTETQKAKIPSASWEERKQKHLKRTKKASKDTLLISCADKLDILEMLIEWYKKDGEKIWQYFHAPEGKKLWFYGELLKIYKKRLGGKITKQYEKTYKQTLKICNKKKAWFK